MVGWLGNRGREGGSDSGRGWEFAEHELVQSLGEVGEGGCG